MNSLLKDLAINSSKHKCFIKIDWQLNEAKLEFVFSES